MSVNKDSKTGKWYFVVKYRDIFGEIKWKKKRGFNTKSQAKKEEHAFILSIEESTYNNTLNALYNEYIQYSKGIKKDSTIDKDIRTYELYIEKPFGHKNLKDISAKEIVLFRNALMDKGLSNTYINNIFKVFNKFFSYASKMYGYNTNPIKLVGRLKEEKRSYDIWTIEEFKRFISAVDIQEFKVAFTLLFNTGVRRGELLGLKWSDYYNGSIDINKSLSYHSNGEYVIGTPKTNNSIRIVKLDKYTNAMMKEYKEVVMQYSNFNEDWFIFGGIEPLALNRLSNIKNRYEKLADVKHIRIHDFRHSHVSFLISNNVPLPAVAKRVGDDINTILDTYTHLFDHSTDELVNIIERSTFGQ